MAFFTLVITIYLAKEAQIALLFVKKVTVPEEYSDFADVFSKKSAEVLPKRMEINKYAIKLQKSKQLSYGPIYSLGLIELKALKIYIEINLANNLIWPSKSPAWALIFYF